MKELSQCPLSESYLFVCPALDFGEYRVEGGQVVLYPVQTWTW